MNTTGTDRDVKANYLIVMTEVTDGAKVPSTFARGKFSDFKAIREIGSCGLPFVFPTYSCTHPIKPLKGETLWLSQ